MGWKRKRKKVIGIYITLFLVCVIVAGALSFIITISIPTLTQEAKRNNWPQEAMQYESFRKKA